VLAGVMHGLRPLFARGRWEVHCILSGVFTSLIVLAQYLMITFRRGSLIFTREIWWQIGGPGLVAMAMAPILFWFLQWIGRIAAYSYQPERGRQSVRSIGGTDRKSTRLNSSHVSISDAVFCLKKKKKYSRT